MKKLLLFSAFLSIASFALAETFIVENAGMTFTPDELNIVEGDEVTWNIGNGHNVVEVSEATWMMNGSTANGGFSLPFGGGSVTFDVPGTYYYVCTPHAGNGMKGQITVSPISNIASVKVDPSISMYPNPSKGNLNLELDPNFIQNVEIIALNGQVFANFKVAQSLTKISVAELNQGIYFVRFIGAEEIITRRLVIE